MEHIERIRGMAAVKCGFVENWEDARTKSTSAPKVSIISAPQDYVDMDGNQVKGEDMDICVRAISVGSLHKAYPMTVAVGTGAAARIPGTIVYETAVNDKNSDVVRLDQDGRREGLKGRRDPDGQKDYGRLCVRERLNRNGSG